MPTLNNRITDYLGMPQYVPPTYQTPTIDPNAPNIFSTIAGAFQVPEQYKQNYAQNYAQKQTQNYNIPTTTSGLYQDLINKTFNRGGTPVGVYAPQPTPQPTNTGGTPVGVYAPQPTPQPTNTGGNIGATQPTPAPVNPNRNLLAPNDPSNMYNTATGALNTNYSGYVAPVVPGSTTVAPPTSANGLYQNVVDPYQSQIDSANAILQNTQQETDPNVIYQRLLQQQQAQIDSINNIYNDQLNSARIQGQGRLGSSTAIQARSGLLGSDIGDAMTKTQEAANTQEQKAIDNQRSAAIQDVYSKIRTSASEETAANRLAKTKGAEALLEFYKVTKPAMRLKKVSSAIKALVSKGVDINSLTNEELQSYLTGLEITQDEFVSAYGSELATQTNAATKLKGEQDKDAADLEYKKAQTSELTGKRDWEANQKELDRRLTQKQIDVSWYNAETSRLKGEKEETDKLPTAEQIKQQIRPMLTSQVFKDMKSKQKRDYILSQGGEPSDYGY